MFNLTPVVKNLLILNVGMFIIQSLSSGFTTHYLSLYDFRSEYYMPYQFLSHMFLHGDFMHLLFNMLWLVFMGPMVEQYIGDKKFTLLFLISGLGSALLHVGANYYELSPRSGMIDIPMLGASGAVAGVMAAVAYLYPTRSMMIFPLPIPIKIKYFVLFYAVRELMNGMGAAETGIAHFAHLGGLLFGFIFILAIGVKPNRS